MANEVKIVVSAVDKASGVFGKIGGALMGIGASLALATKVIKETTAAASDMAETTSKVGVVFGEQSDKIVQWGKNAAEAMGMSNQEALAGAAVYGNLFRAMGMTEKSSADMSTTLVQLSSDLASFNNMNPTEVMDKLRAGISGESEPLKSLGININEVILKEKAMELGLYDGVGALDASAKATAAYKLILEQTTLAQGDFARTADGLANSQRSLKARFDDLKAEVGVGFQGGAGGLTGALYNMVDGLAESQEEINATNEALKRLGIQGSTASLRFFVDGERVTRKWVAEQLHAQQVNDAWSARLEAEAAAWQELHPQISKSTASIREFKENLVNLNDIDPNFADGIKNELEKLDFMQSGGMIYQNLYDQITKAFDDGKIDAPQAADMFQEVYLGAQAVAIKMGESKNDVIKNIMDTFDVTWSEAQKLIDNYINDIEGRKITLWAELRLLNAPAFADVLSGRGVTGPKTWEGEQATGGLGGGRTVVGEMGPEVVDLPPGSRVHTATNSAQMGTGGGGFTDRDLRKLSRYIAEEVARTSR